MLQNISCELTAGLVLDDTEIWSEERVFIQHYFGDLQTKRGEATGDGNRSPFSHSESTKLQYLLIFSQIMQSDFK